MNDWVYKKLGEVCGFQNGFAFKSKSFKESGIPVVRITNIQDGAVKIDKAVHVNPDDYDKEINQFYIQNGDLLIAMSGATTGKIGFCDFEGKALLNQRVGKFIPSDNLNISFLYYYMLGKVDESLAMSVGAAQPNLSTAQIKNFNIPIPPLPEQHRIVSILDKAFATIDQAKANIERNIENAKELFQSKLIKVMAALYKDCGSVTLGEVCDFQNGFAFKSRTFRKEGTPVVRITNIRDERVLIDDTVKVDPNDYAQDLNRYILRNGDLLIAMSGATTGKIGFCDFEDQALLNQRVGKFEPHADLDKDFLFYYLYTRIEENLSISAGAAQPNLSTEQIKSFELPNAPLEVQRYYALVMTNLHRVLIDLRDRYLLKLRNMDELKMSILEQAFNGTLIK